MSIIDNDMDDEFTGPRSIITVSGIPKNNDTDYLQMVLRDIVDSTRGNMTDIEIGVVPDAPDITVAKLKAHGGFDEEITKRIVALNQRGVGVPYDVESFSRAQAAFICILQRTMGFEGQIEDLEETTRTPEEKAKAEQESKDIYAQRDQQNELRFKQYVEERKNELDHAFGVAEQWANKPDLTAEERCHGVAHDMYKKYGAEARPFQGYTDLPGQKTHFDKVQQKAYPTRAGQAYSDEYNRRNQTKIQKRAMRAAGFLFNDD